MTSEAAKAPFVRALHQGDTGPDVKAVKRALIRWNDGKTAGVADTTLLGGQAVELLRHFQQLEKLHVDGIYGPATHARLAPFFDAYGAELLHDETVLLEPRNLLLAIADLTVIHAGLFAYTELIGEAPGCRDWFRVAPIDTTATNWAQVVAIHGKLTSDCSGHYYGCAWHAGIHLPTPDGATGALLELARAHAVALPDAQPGDGVIFVGPDYPAGHHITFLRAKTSGGWRCVNNGGPVGAGPSYSTLAVEQAAQARFGASELVVVRAAA